MHTYCQGHKFRKSSKNNWQITKVILWCQINNACACIFNWPIKICIFYKNLTSPASFVTKTKPIRTQLSKSLLEKCSIFAT